MTPTFSYLKHIHLLGFHFMAANEVLFIYLSFLLNSYFFPNFLLGITIYIYFKNERNKKWKIRGDLEAVAGDENAFIAFNWLMLESYLDL